jgi:hypothetical protein
MPSRTIRVGERRPSRSHHSTHPVQGTRSRRGAIVVLAGLAMVASGLFSPVAAADPSGRKPSAEWSTGRHRSVTTHHTPSARVAATAKPRLHAPARPLLKAKIAHPPAATSGPLVGDRKINTKPQIVGPPDLTPTLQFGALDQAEGGNTYPADPWIAVSGSYVVQVVNSTARISTRSGVELSSVPTWALFALPDGQFDSDARIIWDAAHARWVGTSLSFNGALTQNYLNLIVSDGADPRAGWTTYSFAYGAELPDYPSIASSSDKIVLTDNLFDATSALVGAELVTVTWASILANTGPTVNSCTSPLYVNARAAQVLSSSSDVHVIFESTADSNQWYWRIRGAGGCLLILDGTELGAFAPFTVAPDPRQFPGDTVTNAFDERPTDAVWQNGRLWWVSTFPWTYDLGSTYNDAVVLWTATTQTNGAPAEGTPVPITPGDGIDAFMGGIGMTRGGTLVTTYSQSSASDYIYLMANQLPPAGSLASPIQLDYGDSSYGQERWGDFAGVAMDPVGTGSVWATHMVAGPGGTWRTDVARLVTDGDLPTMPGAPVPALVPGPLGQSVSVRLSWAASTDVGSDVAKYQVQQRIDSGSFVEVTSTSATSIVRPLLVNHTYQFEIRAIDEIGNLGPWRLSTTLKPWLIQSTSGTTLTGSWGTSTSSAYSGGSTRYASSAGASATFTASTARSIAIVATKAASRGSFKVYVDGVYRGRISTYSTTTKYRQLVFQYNWSAPGTHKVKIVVSGTAGHPRVDVDAFVVLR